MTSPLDKIPPQSIEAEQATLGACMLDRDAIDAAAELVQPGDFYKPSHQALFRGILHLRDTGQPVDLITLGELLKTHNHLDEIGGTLYLTTLMSQAPSAAFALQYAGIVREKAIRRALITTADNIMHDAYGDEYELDDLLRRANEQVLHIEQSLTDRVEAPSVGDYADLFYNRLQHTAKHGIPPGFKTAWKGVNERIHPFTPGQLIVIAADTGCGKTAWALNQAQHLAGEGRRGIVFSLEMEGEDLSVRAILKTSNCTQDDFDEIHQHPEVAGVLADVRKQADKLRALPLKIDDRAGNSVLRIERAMQNEIHAGGPLEFVVVDYLQLVPSDPTGRKRYEEVGNITKELKRIAKQYKLVVFALCQLSTKELAKRSTRRPQINDIYESARITQDADLVVMLYWPGRYGLAEVEAAGYDPQRHQNIVEFWVLKARHGTPKGPTSNTGLYYDGPHYDFRDLTPAQWHELSELRRR